MQKLRKGDTVKVITGKCKGEEGIIKKISYKDGYVVVEKVNMIKKHKKPTNDNPEGGIVELEGKIHLSNVMIIDKKAKKPSRVGIIFDEKGKKKRIFKKSKKIID
ncbi:50S ribosomal protein L24 [symbiont of Argiope bruennichi]|uniref:50S ribosomal protein L24 n=1 Tax=symbiont of Argiope bruennichi TaxID=2810479 RepID=UPI003DA359AB